MLRRALVRVLLVSLALLPLVPTAGLASLDAPEPLPPVAPHDPRFGIVQAIQSPGLASALGASWERIIFPWSVMEREPGRIGPGYFSEARIRAQAERGFTIVGLLIYTPDWAAPDPRRPHPKFVPRNLHLPWNDPDNYWGRFVWQVASRYQGVVDHWIVWNEPDIYDPSGRYSFDGSFEEYYELVKVAYQAAKAANPQSKVLLGGFAYWLDQAHGRPPYLASLLEVASRDRTARANGYYFDAVVVHTYANPLNSYAVPMLMRRILRDRGLEKPVWIGESNAVPGDDVRAPTKPGSFRASLAEQAAYIIQAHALSLAAGVERHGVYKLLDEQPEDGQWFGLVRNDGSLRPAYLAYQVAATYLADARSATYSWRGSSSPPTEAEITGLLNSNRGRTQFQWPGDVNRVIVERGTRRTTVVWNSSRETIEARVPAAAPYALAVTPYGETGQFVARDGFYELELVGSRHNADPNDRSVNLIGGPPWILEEAVVPLPERVRTRIESLTPRGGLPPEEARSADLVAHLLLRDGSAPVPCRWEPRVLLWASLNGAEHRLAGTGRKDWLLRDGRRDPVWRFENLDVSPVLDGESWLDFSVVVEGVPTEAEAWVYRLPRPTPTPEPTPSALGAQAAATPTPTPEPERLPGPPPSEYLGPVVPPGVCK